MHLSLSRKPVPAVLAAAAAAAAAIALSSSGQALADTTDTGGTATITFSVTYLEHLAKAGILVLPENPATGSYASGFYDATFNVTGGNGDVNNFFGAVKIGGGKLRLVNATNGRTIILAGLSFNFNTGALSAKPVGSTTRVALFDIGGNLSESNSAGPPQTETFSCSQFPVDPSGAAFLDNALGTKAFAAGADAGGFTTTFDVTVT